MKETKLTSGIIEDKTEDSIKVNNLWIKFFDKEKLESFTVDNKVKVSYNDNIKNNKTYHNGKEIELIKELVQPRTSTSDTTINTLIMSMKDIYLSEDNTDSMEVIAERLVKGYLKIKQLI